MELLETGVYEPDHRVTVTHWNKPDKHGDGDDVYVEKRDGQGNSLGADLLMDEHGNAVRSYSPPDGFQNKPSFDGTANWVRCSPRGMPIRDKNGLAVCIQEGATLLEYADGSSKLLTDDLSRYHFSKAYRMVSEDATPIEDDEAPEDPAASSDKDSA